MTEGCRGEGGYLLNKGRRALHGALCAERQDLAGRDVVARSIMIEIREGRGCDGPWGPHISSSSWIISAKRCWNPVCRASASSLAPSPTWIGQRAHPIIPTCHYMMGGVPTSVNGQCLTQDKDGNDVPVVGLFAVGRSPASPCTVPTVWWQLPCWIWWCSVVLPACTWWRPWFDGARRGSHRRRHRQGAGALQPLGKQP